MNVFNCHVNRSPLAGTVEEINYKPGKFLNASLDKASEDNERNYYRIKCKKSGEEIIIVQIAGLIARRIVTDVEQGQSLKQGERIGMIRFGSRVDIYFKNKKILAKVWTKCSSRRKFNSFRIMEENKKFKLVSSKKTRYLLPNILTLGGVCFGISSIKFSIDGNYSLAVIFIILAAVLDALDGRIARLIKGTSEFGKELDLAYGFRKFWNSTSFYFIFLGIK